MRRMTMAQNCVLGATILCLTLAGGCAALNATKTPPPAFYALNNAGMPAPTAIPVSVASSPSTLTLLVSPTHAASGVTSQRIIYLRDAHKLEYFAHSEWIEPPARMLAPLIVAALETGGGFRAVVTTPSVAAGDLRLDTEIIRLQHDFQTQPSHVRFTLRAYLVEEKTRRVLDWREFDSVVPATSGNPYGGVVAANQAVQTALEELAAFCREVAFRAKSGSKAQ